MLDNLVEAPAAGGNIAPAVSVPAGRTVAGGPDGSKHKTLCILGSHPATVKQAPFHDESAYIWACSPDNTPYGLSPHARQLPRVNAWAELHNPIGDKSRPYAYLRAISELPLVWMRDKAAMASGFFPGARPYPEREMKEKFNPFAFTSSVAYLLAKAITDCEEQGIRQIALYGIMQGGNLDPANQAQSPEYAYQRPGTQYFIWEATRRGIKVLAAKESRLFELPPEVW
jgi:hypothetical protein